LLVGCGISKEHFAKGSSESTDDIEKVLANLNTSVNNTVPSIGIRQERTSISVDHAEKNFPKGIIRKGTLCK